MKQDMILKNNTKILNDEALVVAIEKYVDEYLYNYAVMIDGTWGCGKLTLLQMF